MIELRNYQISKEGLYIVKNKDIESFAYKQLRDYDKNYFKNPHPLDAEEFVEFYLEKKINYYKLSFDGNVLGTTSVKSGIMPVILEDGKTSIIKLGVGDICIDINACITEERVRFTSLHESWHSQFDLNVSDHVLYQKKNIVDNHANLDIKCNSTKSAYDWMEYHANMYAVYLLMPAIFVKKLFDYHYNEWFRKYNKRISVKNPKRTWALIAKIASDLNVSKQALAIRLKELSLISTKVFNSLSINNE